MKIANFNQNPQSKIGKINEYLKENHGIKVTGFHTKAKLENVREQAEQKVITLRNSNKKFNLDPEYAKYLGVKDVIDVMLEEGMYAESPAMEAMKAEVEETTKQLMDSGYTVDEASKECMNRFRQDSRYAYDDEFVLPIVLKAAKEYYESGCGTHEGMYEEPNGKDAPEFPSNDPATFLDAFQLGEMARELGMKVDEVATLDAIEEKLELFAQVSGKSRNAVVEFLNSLEEGDVTGGIQMFGMKVSEQNKFTGARKDAIKAGKDSFEVDGKVYKITGDTKDEEMQEGVFDNIIDEMLAEEVDVEQAEVVMAARALSDDIQDMIARLGKMANEDLPAIADQMRAEMGADVAAGFNEQMNSTLSAHLDATKATKDAMETAIAGITGDAPLGAPGGDMALADMPAPEEDPSIDDMAMDTVEPAAAGPEEEPLGRAPVEL